MINEVILLIRKDLTESSDPKTKASFQRFFKEDVTFYGTKSSEISKISKRYYDRVKLLPKQKIFNLCDELFKSGFSEEAWIAANWVYWVHDRFEEKDFQQFELWIDKYIDNWAKCDTFCNHAVGEYVVQYPSYIDTLKIWSKSSNRWMRRASAVSLIIPAKEGRFLSDIFEIADILLLDRDDLVQKGYGWLLKEASRKHQQEVFDFVCKRKADMPRTALRYAIEKMPVKLRKKAMEKD